MYVYHVFDCNRFVEEVLGMYMHRVHYVCMSLQLN